MDDSDEWPSKADREVAISRAQKLRARAAKGGLRFKAYLPPDLALWLLDRIEQGKFHDPSEAAFILLKQGKELEPHADLRRELLRRGLQAAMDDPRAGIPYARVAVEMEKWQSQPLPDPAVWERR